MGLESVDTSLGDGRVRLSREVVIQQSRKSKILFLGDGVASHCRRKYLVYGQRFEQNAV